MKKLNVVVISGRHLTVFMVFTLTVLIGLFFYGLLFESTPVIEFIDPQNGVIVIDPGHGGIDGGANRNGLLEKDVNLSIALKLQGILEAKGYTVIMTRCEDISLESLDPIGTGGRHKRDLNARTELINNSNAQLFVSIHVNSSKNSKTNGSILYYNSRIRQNEDLAISIQESLNYMNVNGLKRTARQPQTADFFLLTHTKIPGVIIETAFISNPTEMKLLAQDEFQSQLAFAIAEGIEHYLIKMPSYVQPK